MCIEVDMEICSIVFGGQSTLSSLTFLNVGLNNVNRNGKGALCGNFINYILFFVVFLFPHFRRVA